MSIISVWSRSEYSERHREFFLKFNPIGVSDMNPYIPMFAYFTGTIIKKGDERKFMYSPVITTGNINADVERNERDIYGKKLFKHVESGYHTITSVYDSVYYTHKHCLYQLNKETNEITFLFLLAVEREHFMEKRKRDAVLDNNKLLFLVSNDIYLPQHDSIRRRIKKYIDTYLSGIDILYTDKINSWCFNNNLKNIRFKDVIQRINFIENVKSMYYERKVEEPEPREEEANYHSPWINITRTTGTLSSA